MPQNDKVRAGTGTTVNVPVTSSSASAVQEYRKEKKCMKKKGGPMNHIVNPNFTAALPGMIRNIEGIIAAKANLANSHIHLADIKVRGENEVKEKRKEMQKSLQRNKLVKKVLKKSRNAKGVRGEFDVDELSELSPELQQILINQQKQKATKNLSTDETTLVVASTNSNNNQNKYKKRPRTEDKDDDDNDKEDDGDEDDDNDDNESTENTTDDTPVIVGSSANSSSSARTSGTNTITNTGKTTTTLTNSKAQTTKTKHNIQSTLKGNKNRSQIDIGKAPDYSTLFNTEASIAAEFGADFL